MQATLCAFMLLTSWLSSRSNIVAADKSLTPAPQTLNTRIYVRDHEITEADQVANVIDRILDDVQVDDVRLRDDKSAGAASSSINAYAANQGREARVGGRRISGPDGAQAAWPRAWRFERSSRTGANLNMSFIALFDELSRIKSRSAEALAHLQYFRSAPLGNGYGTTRSAATGSPGDGHGNNSNYTNNSSEQYMMTTGPSTTTHRANATHVVRPINNMMPSSNNNNKLVNRSSTTSNRGVQSTRKPLLHDIVAESDDDDADENNPKKRVVGVSLRAGTWLDALVAKLHSTMATYTSGYLGRHARALDNVNFTDYSRSLRLKRHDDAIDVVEKPASVFDGKLTGASFACRPMDSAAINRCREVEIEVGTDLDTSFPGTMDAIENNCRNLAYLFGHCWPQQLSHIRRIVATRNESALAQTDFPLPKPLAASAEPCGSPVSLSMAVMDRVTWMWINLCMDKRFRIDYIDNLQCLRVWTQERVQNNCRNEFKRIQTALSSITSAAINLTGSSPSSPSPSDMRSLAQQHLAYHSNVMSVADRHHAFDATRNLYSRPAHQHASIVHSYAGGARNSVLSTTVVPKDSAQTDQELESKALCCMFDSLLRCVNKEAQRDCSRAGAHFVVNFLTRVGTDDLKYMCNTEQRNNSIVRHKPSHSTPGARRNTQVAHRSASHERSPFIESNYCLDARIQTIINGPSHGRYTSGSRLIPKGVNRTQSSGDAWTTYDSNSSSTSLRASTFSTLAFAIWTSLMLIHG